MSDELLKIGLTLLGPILTLFCGLVLFFLRRLITKNDQLILHTSDNMTNNRLISQELVSLGNKFSEVESAARDMLILREEVKDLVEEQTILDRNQKTVFRKLDELRSDMETLAGVTTDTAKATHAQKQRILYVATKLAKVRGLLEKDNIIDLKEDMWILPEG